MSPDLAARAETLLQRARLAFARGSHAVTRRFLEEGLALVSGSGLPVEAALLVQSAQLAAWDYDPESSRVAATRALEAARASGSFLPDAELLVAQALLIMRDERCIEYFRGAWSAAELESDLDLACEARIGLVGALQVFARSGEALQAAVDLERDASAAGKTLSAKQAEWLRIRIEWLASGNGARAVPALRAISRSRALGLHGPQVLADLALALADAGEVEDARRAIARARRAADTRWTASVAAFYRAEIEWAADRPARALAAAVEAITEAPPAPTSLVARGTRQWALFELGQPQYDPTLEAIPAITFLAATHTENRAFALLAAGDSEAAERAFVAAAQEWHGNVARCELRALWGQGELARRRGDAAASVSVLRDVESRAAAIGLVPILARARRSLSHLPARPPRRAPASRLSRREQEVLHHVGGGLRTIEIAARLRISPRTIDAHVRSAMAKLGASTRLEAAALTLTGEAPPPAHASVPPEEMELVQLLAEGLTVTQAATAVGISRRTATRRLQRLREQLRVRTNAEAALLVRQFGT